MTPHAFSISLSMQDLHSTLLHKYGSIRTPLHPLRLRSAPCDVLSEYASVARLAGAAPPVLDRIYETRYRPHPQYLI